jgi:hypothetical protein
VLNIPMAEIILNQSRIGSLVGKGEATTVPQHVAMESPEELRTLTAWKAHTMTGDRKGTVSLSVTRNYRLTFRVSTAESEIYDVNLEDYH